MGAAALSWLVTSCAASQNMTGLGPCTLHLEAGSLRQLGAAQGHCPMAWQIWQIWRIWCFTPMT